MEEILELVTQKLGLRRLDGWQNDLGQILGSLRTRFAVRTDAEVLTRLLRSESNLAEFAGRLTINESFFFRHPTQLELITREVIARHHKNRGNGTIRIWSAGCSRGQEPYSIAISLLMGLEPAALKSIEITATDLSGEVIAQAQAGVYSVWSVRTMEKKQIEQWFTSVGNGGLKLKSDVRALVRFEQSSIQATMAKWPPSSFDFILFRNVAIYLEEGTLKRIYRCFRELLKPDGLLFISPGDPWPQPDLFALRLDTNETAFAPAGRQATPAVPAPTLAVVTKPPAPPPPEPDPNVRLRFERRFAEVLRAADHGQNELAIALVNDLLAEDRRDAQAMLVRGQLYLAKGDLERCIKDFGQAASLAPNEPLIRYWYALALQRHGAVKRAQSQVKVLKELISKSAGHEACFDNSTTHKDLAIAAEQLEQSLG